MRVDRYELHELIGEGVSAKVYRAVDTATDSVVAVKVLNVQLQNDAISEQRFRREIQITRLLNHPQIVSIYDLLQANGHTCLVMEYVDGQNLKDFVALHGALPIAAAVAVLSQILRILSVCHRKNVIHRDLKPQNVMVNEEHIVRLLDFGIAKMTTLSDLTQTGTAVGTPE